MADLQTCQRNTELLTIERLGEYWRNRSTRKDNTRQETSECGINSIMTTTISELQSHLCRGFADVFPTGFLVGPSDIEALSKVKYAGRTSVNNPS